MPSAPGRARWHGGGRERRGNRGPRGRATCFPSTTPALGGGGGLPSPKDRKLSLYLGWCRATINGAE